MANYQVVAALGVVLMIAGGVPAAIGTTSTALFAFYGVLLLAGAGLMALSKRMRDAR